MVTPKPAPLNFFWRLRAIAVTALPVIKLYNSPFLNWLFGILLVKQLIESTTFLENPQRSVEKNNLFLTSGDAKMQNNAANLRLIHPPILIYSLIHTPIDFLVRYLSTFILTKLISLNDLGHLII